MGSVILNYYDLINCLICFVFIMQPSCIPHYMSCLSVFPSVMYGLVTQKQTRIKINVGVNVP